MLQVVDDVIRDNNGWFTLTVDKGAAVSVTRRPVSNPPASSAGVVIDVRGLASLYTGHSQPDTLMCAGLLRVVCPAREAPSGSDGDGDGDSGSGAGSGAGAGAGAGASGEEDVVEALRALFCASGQPAAVDAF